MYYSHDMCRMFGLVVEAPVSTQYWMTDCPYPFRSWSDVHRHGWGIGWYEHGDPSLTKESLTALDSAQFALTSASAKSQLFMCHLRKATCGEHTEKNTHPFNYGLWLFAHNGTIDGLYFRSLLTKPHQAALIGDADSEVYFHWLLQAMEREGVEGLRRGIRDVREREFTALNFLLSDGHTLYAYWEQSRTAEPPHSDYYQLQYAVRSSGQTGIRQVVICSERLDNDSWVRIPQASLFSVMPDLQVKIAAV